MHGNARLTPLGRFTLVVRIEEGRPVAHVAKEMGVSRPTAYKWWHRWLKDGLDGLVDRPSRARSCPHRTSPELEEAVAELRRELKLGPVRIAARLGLAASTVHRVLCRLGLNRLAWMDRPTGRVVRRYERAVPGELVHVDIKKLGRIPDGGGWRVLGRQAGIRNNDGHGARRVGYGFVHSAVDDRSRLAYSEVLADETKETAASFWRRAVAWFAHHDVDVRAVLTDNGSCYRSLRFAEALDNVEHLRTRPYRPQTNGKVERFNRTLLEEWAYVRPYASEAERIAALDDWLHLYNHHRHHTAVGGPPISRVNDPAGQYN
jgi:transposase InsO family protein